MKLHFDRNELEFLVALFFLLPFKCLFDIFIYYHQIEIKLISNAKV